MAIEAATGQFPSLSNISAELVINTGTVIVPLATVTLESGMFDAFVTPTPPVTYSYPIG